MMMSTDVIGARMMPEKTAPIPTSAKAPMGSPVWCSSEASSVPIAPPSMPPMNRAGAKMPPAPPLP